jgi:hypothetical protein
MRSSPQVGLLRAILAMRFCRSAGTRGLPLGLDFHLQNNRKPLRCQRGKVSGLRMTSASFHANHGERSAKVRRVAS